MTNEVPNCKMNLSVTLADQHIIIKQGGAQFCRLAKLSTHTVF